MSSDYCQHDLEVFLNKVNVLFEEARHTLHLSLHAVFIAEIQTSLDIWREKLVTCGILITSQLIKPHHLSDNHNPRSNDDNNSVYDKVENYVEIQTDSKRGDHLITRDLDPLTRGDLHGCDQAGDVIQCEDQPIETVRDASPVTNSTVCSPTRKSTRKRVKPKFLDCDANQFDNDENKLNIINRNKPAKAKVKRFDVDKKNDYKCPECDYQTTQRSWRDKHIAAKHERKYEHLCDICAQGFCYESVLKRHIASVHGMGELLSCDQCSFTCFVKQNVDAHKKAKHSDLPPQWKCEMCGQYFSCKSTLTDHVRIHLDEKKYQCPECPAAFISRSSKNRHLNSRHKDVQYCCTGCTKIFRSKATLNRHKVIHTGEKNFSCEFCDHRCNTRTNLRKHWRSIHKLINHDMRRTPVVKLDKHPESENAMTQILPQMIVDSAQDFTLGVSDGPKYLVNMSPCVEVIGEKTTFDCDDISSEMNDVSVETTIINTQVLDNGQSLQYKFTYYDSEQTCETL